MPRNRVSQKQKGESSVFDVCRAGLKPWDLGVNFSWKKLWAALIAFQENLMKHKIPTLATVYNVDGDHLLLPLKFCFKEYTFFHNCDTLPSNHQTQVSACRCISVRLDLHSPTLLGTLLETKKSPPKDTQGIVEDYFPLLQVGYVSSLEGIQTGPMLGP